MPTSTYQLLRDAARAWPDAVATEWIPDPAAYSDCLMWTYRDLARQVTQIANALTALGVRRADAVTLCGVNTSTLYAATLAAQAVGIAAPVNPVLSAEHLTELIRRTGSRVVIAAGPELDQARWDRLLKVCATVGVRAVLVLRPDAATGAPPPLPASTGMLVAYLDDVAAAHPADRLVGAQPPAPGDLAAFVHTGGTTGAPKVAAHTHANQLTCARGIALSTGLAPGEAVLGGLPLFHVNALLVTGLGPMFAGLRVVWPGPAGYRNPDLYTRFWKIVEHCRIVAMSAVPTVYATLARVPVDADISSLRLPIVGASPLPPSVREDFAAHTGRRLLEGYGLTEATCASTFTPPGEGRIGSVGRALPGQRVKAVLIGEDGSWTDCAPGGVGVLAIGGPCVFAGYVTEPAAGGPRVSRDDIVRDGWLNTGDRHAGEVPVAYVVPIDPDRFDEAQLHAWAATAIGEPAARPKRIHPIPAIPTTEVGKQYKPALAADAAARVVSETLADAGVPAGAVIAQHQNGRLVVTVAAADPEQVREALAGFALTVTTLP
jgi:fatty-acyl-CoA synthase